MCKIRKIVLILSMVLGASASAESFKLRSVSLEIKVPKDWSTVQGLYATDLAVLSKENDEGTKRTVLSIFDSETTVDKSIWKNSLKTKEIFFEGRKKWVDSVGGNFRKELSSREIPESKGLSGIEFSFEYDVEGSVYREYSYYLTCGTEFIFFKGLVPESGFKAEEKKLREIATTVACSTPKNATATLSAEEIKALISKISGKKNARSGSAVAVETISVLRSFVIGYEGGQPDEVEPADDPDRKSVV